MSLWENYAFSKPVEKIYFSPHLFPQSCAAIYFIPHPVTNHNVLCYVEHRTPLKLDEFMSANIESEVILSIKFYGIYSMRAEKV